MPTMLIERGGREGRNTDGVRRESDVEAEGIETLLRVTRVGRPGN
jgi:hypothetical protein